MDSNKKRARDNEMAVLQAVGLVGWLSTSQVGQWVWGSDNARSARVSAEKVLKRLQAGGYVMRRESDAGVFVYVLTKAGALRANEGVKVELFKDGYDLSQLDVYRQRVAVDYLIAQHQAGRTVLGAAGVRKGCAEGVLKAGVLKGADGLVLDNESGLQKAVLVVRNLHPGLVKKAKRLKKGVGELELLGEAGLLKHFRREMGR